MSENIQCRLMDFRVYLFTIRGHPHKDSDICVVQSTNLTFLKHEELIVHGGGVGGLEHSCWVVDSHWRNILALQRPPTLIFFSLEVFPFCHFCLFKTISLWFSFTSAIPSSFLCLVFLLTLTAGRSKCATQVLHSCILCNEASLLQPQIQNSWFKKRWS